MQKLLILACVLLLLTPLMGTQRYVVGEVFTATW